jgi:hypothetical protein
MIKAGSSFASAVVNLDAISDALVDSAELGKKPELSFF